MRRLLSLVCACAALAGTGCGDDDGASDGARVAGAAVTVVMTDYAYDPQDVAVERGGVIAVTNEGGIAHNLTIEKGPDQRRDTEDLAGTSSFLKGKTEILDVDLPPGRYAMVCTVPGHRELGMVGTLRVR
jgi:plastocyanin